MRDLRYGRPESPCVINAILSAEKVSKFHTKGKPLEIWEGAECNWDDLILMVDVR